MEIMALIAILAVVITILGLVWRGASILLSKANKTDLEELWRRKVETDACLENLKRAREDKHEIWQAVGANREMINQAGREFAEAKGTIGAFIEQAKEMNKILIDSIKKVNGGGKC